jgi:small GTP-binding protein
MYYKGAKAILIVYDITSPDSFEGAKKWVTELETNTHNILLVLIGNKTDLESNRKISYETAKSYAYLKQIPFFECSAKENKGIKEIFYFTADKIPKEENKKGISVNDVNKSDDKNEACSC